MAGIELGPPAQQASTLSIPPMPLGSLWPSCLEPLSGLKYIGSNPGSEEKGLYVAALQIVDLSTSTSSELQTLQETQTQHEQ